MSRRVVLATRIMTAKRLKRALEALLKAHADPIAMRLRLGGGK